MIDLSDDPRRTRMTPEAFAYLLVLNEQELNRRILWDLANHPSFAARYLAFAISHGADEGEFARSAAVARPGILNRAFRMYRDWKRRILGFPGSQVARFIRANSRDGGLSFCKKIKYCRRKASIKEKLGMLNEVGPVTALTAKQVAAHLKDHAPGVLELFSELVTEVTGAAVDTFIPVSLLVKLFKYGLDDLCPCCRKCLGSGKVNGADCPACNGDGLLNPFPLPTSSPTNKAIVHFLCWAESGRSQGRRQVGIGLAKLTIE